MEITQTLQVHTDARGAVPPNSMDVAVEKVRAALRHASEPVLFVKVKLTMSADPAVQRPAVAQVNLDFNGRLIRAQANAESMHEAIDLMCGRLKVRIDRAARNWAAVGGSKPVPLSGEWRHRERPGTPAALLSPAARGARGDQAQVLRADPGDPGRGGDRDGAARLRLLPVHRARHRAGQRAVPDVQRFRAGPGPPAARRARPDSGLDHGQRPATPRLDTPAAIDRMEALGQPFLFFIDSETGRGSLIYHRYDGHYGHITSAGTK